MPAIVPGGAVVLAATAEALAGPTALARQVFEVSAVVKVTGPVARMAAFGKQIGAFLAATFPQLSPTGHGLRVAARTLKDLCKLT